MKLEWPRLIAIAATGWMLVEGRDRCSRFEGVGTSSAQEALLSRAFRLAPASIELSPSQRYLKMTPRRATTR